MKKNTLPQSLKEAVKYFSDNAVCVQFVANLRWPDGKPMCPRCTCERTSFLSTRLIWKCKGCKKQFSVKLNTIFEESGISLENWLIAIWQIANCKNGISSYELARDLGLTQKSAWFLLHRIRRAMQIGTFERLRGEIEVDETFVGGKAVNMHASKRKARIKGRGGATKQAVVLGMLQRQGKVRATVIERTDHETLQNEVREYVVKGSNVYTDEWRSYKGLIDEYNHQVINHSVEYVRGNAHTNSIENFWSLLKRTLKGTYVSVDPAHLQSYVSEQTFRYNERHGTDLDRFLKLLGNAFGKRLTYADLTRSVIRF